MNLNSINYVCVSNVKAAINSTIYFPNVTRLAIRSLEMSDHSISWTLNSLLPLNKLTELNLVSYRIIVDDLLKLLRFTPNLNLLGLEALIVDEPTLNLRRKRKRFKYITGTKKIKHLRIDAQFSWKKLRFVAYLFPKLEYLEIKYIPNEIIDIFRLILTKPNHILQNLFLVCIRYCSTKYLEGLDNLIRSEHLVDDYVIKYGDDDLYLWW
ncbi:unnamed protein product [Rotaria magnacalcarata]|uniref:Uncharacterized protein n=1 Tax=Rotaria magnacalcarata TaxID=392030 RepID=A0A815J1W0_9BILA|nr:unnamed protein product [Rotaria magnacalcarata]CAF1658615.1 unnamed protein product [Rotaria magnacalcarata]CAF4198006.1 unnamed protein product [Rotaria magnacalcarata]CAF4227161.1 unnamed protein product [Rotaria magnacalcarata]